jgi:hypothetical protein
MRGVTSGAVGSGVNAAEALNAESVTGASTNAVAVVDAEAPFKLLAFLRNVPIAASDATSAAVAPEKVNV